MDEITTPVEEDTMAPPAGDIRAEIDLLPGNPSRPLDWRWRRAGLLVGQCKRPRRRDDAWVARASRFRAALDRCGSDLDHPRLAGLDPPVLEACRLRRGDARRRWELEARLLAAQSDGEVAAKVGVGSEEVMAYEKMFYDVRAGLGSPDWVAFRAIGPGLYGAVDPGELEVHWKWFAYHGGPLVLDALVAATAGGPSDPPPGGVDATLAGEIRLALAVMALPVTPANATDVMRLHQLRVELDRRGAASGIAAIAGPIVAAPPEVAIRAAAGPVDRGGLAPGEEEAPGANGVGPSADGDGPTGLGIREAS